MACQRYSVLVHAYVLMTTHVHLLMTSLKKDSISLTMQSLRRRYIHYINKEYRRTGTLWEGRHKTNLVDEDNYLLKCMRHIELNPVRANMVNLPEEYRWSSYLCNGLNGYNKLITPHKVYEALGSQTDNRAEASNSI